MEGNTDEEFYEALEYPCNLFDNDLKTICDKQTELLESPENTFQKSRGTPDEQKQENINIWRYMDNNRDGEVTAVNQSVEIIKSNLNSSHIEEEVKELEMEIEQMFEKANKKKLEVFEDTSFKQLSSAKNSSQSQNSNKKLIIEENKHLYTKPNQVSLDADVGYEPRKFQVSYAHKNSCDNTCSSIESKTDWKNVPGKALIDEAEKVGLLKKHENADILPESLECEVKNGIIKVDIFKNLNKAETILDNTNFYGIDESKSSYSRKKFRGKITPEFKRTRSQTANSDNTKKARKNFCSKTFYADNLNDCRTLTGALSKSKIGGKMSEKISENKCKKGVRKIKKNKGINTERITSKNFSCQKIGAFIDSTNFCSISLTLQSSHMNVGKEDLLISLKDHFWHIESPKEKALVQFVILCMEGNFDEISIRNEKFKLYCQNEFSSCPAENERKMSLESNLICQPLFIETILSRSQVNRLDLESKFVNSSENESNV